MKLQIKNVSLILTPFMLSGCSALFEFDIKRLMWAFFGSLLLAVIWGIISFFNSKNK